MIALHRERVILTLPGRIMQKRRKKEPRRETIYARASRARGTSVVITLGASPKGEGGIVDGWWAERRAFCLYERYSFSGHGRDKKRVRETALRNLLIFLFCSWDSGCDRGVSRGIGILRRSVREIFVVGSGWEMMRGSKLVGDGGGLCIVERWWCVDDRVAWLWNREITIQQIRSLIVN